MAPPPMAWAFVCAGAASVSVATIFGTALFNSLFFPEEASKATPQSTTLKGKNVNVARVSKASTESNSKGGNEKKMMKLLSFKQFDIVDEDCSDHYYRKQGLVGLHQPQRSWAKKIQEEWKILEDNLPGSIYVRAYESRMDLMRVAIIGADGTPYHDGLFFFDIMFPPSYPHAPPKVHYHSGGLRLNPNLYNCGKVCLSLLGTWIGASTERWLPQESTMLQVLVSIQALILNSKPFFNEPGYEIIYRTVVGEKKSRSYNERVFILSLKTMMYSLKNPPKHFEDLVTSHFRIRALRILTACKAYNKGAEVGSDLAEMGQQAKIKVIDTSSSADEYFKSLLAPMVQNLAQAFINNGSRDCHKFKWAHNGSSRIT